MKKKKTIGIIGAGFVGNAVKIGFEKFFNIEIFDIDETKRTVASINELVSKTKDIFVCVPTPMHIETGECDVSIVEGILKQLDRICDKHNIVIKSTTPPDKIEKFEKGYANINLIANPEFLTEANAVDDFLNQNRIILGGKYLNSLIKIYKEAFPDVPIYETNVKTAMMMKYMTNCFLATKVSFANEMYQICEKLGIKYDDVKSLVLLDKRIGKSHFNVPNGGKFYFRGHCLPKDLNEIKYLGKKLDIDTKVLYGVWEKNLEQPEEDMDWLKMTGRAVSKK